MVELENFSDFNIRHRKSINVLWKFAEERHILPSAVCLYFTVGHHQFRIRMINVREYRRKWEKRYKTKWKHG